MNEEEINKNIKSYKVGMGQKGINDLVSEYAFHGNSQGDTGVSNDIADYEKSQGWMSYNFKDVPMNQEAINAEVLRRKKENEDYIQKCKEDGTYGEELPPMTFHLVDLPQWSQPSVLKSPAIDCGKEVQLRMEYNRLLGEYIGTVSGVMLNDIPDELRRNLEGVLADLREQENKMDNNEISTKKSRCCGMCNGVDDICVADMICKEHNEMGCEICYGKRTGQRF